MPETTHKFLFVGIMVAMTMVVSQGAYFSRGDTTGGVEQVTGVQSPPLFVLFSPPPPPPVFPDVASPKSAFNASTLLTSGLVPLVGGEGRFGEDEALPPAVGTEGLAASRNGTMASSSLPRPQAQIALVARLASGEKYFALAAEKRWPLASLTKLMSAVIVLQEMDLKKTVTLEESDFVVQNTREYFKPGDRIRREDLLRAMLVASSNEAAEALARDFGTADFVDLMNLNAKRWGLLNTHFDDPTGISAANQSTASDLCLLAERINKEYPGVWKITREPHIFVVEQATKAARSLGNINAFAGASHFVGGKTGYTDEAESNLLTLFSYNKETLCVVVLGTSDRFKETQELFAWFKETHP